jgi:hypothetical protein
VESVLVDFVEMPIVMAGFSCAVVAGFGAWLWAAQRLAGARIAYRDVIRATAYAQVYVLLATPALLAPVVFGDRVVLIEWIADVLVVAAQVRALAAFFRGRGLGRGAALGSAASAAVAGLVAWVLWESRG